MFGAKLDKFFFRLFPPPKFLVAPSFGLDISDESLKFTELTMTKKGLRIGRSGEVTIPPGIIESGKIIDPHRMEEMLTKLRDEQGVKSVHISLPEEQVYLFQLRLDKQGLVSVKEGIELALEEHVPIAAQDAIFDYDLITEDAKNLEVQVAAITENVLQNYLKSFHNANILVKSCELEGQAIARAVIKKGDMDTYMLVDFGKKRTGIFIVSRGIVMFTSTLDVGGRMLTDMIQKNFNVTFEEADKMKHDYGLKRNTDNKEIFSVILNSVSVLRDEIAKHYLYWNTHKDEEGKNNPLISKIIFCGGDANLTGLVDYISISMKTKVELANVWSNIIDIEAFTPQMTFNKSLAFATTLGLALVDYKL